MLRRKPQDEVEEGSDANVADSAVASKTEVPANEEKLAETSADKTTAPVAPVTETKETETVADQAAPAVEKIEEPVRQEEKVEAPLVGESVAHEVEDKTQPPQPEASVSRDLENGGDDKGTCRGLLLKSQNERSVCHCGQQPEGKEGEKEMTMCSHHPFLISCSPHIDHRYFPHRLGALPFHLRGRRRRAYYLSSS